METCKKYEVMFVIYFFQLVLKPYHFAVFNVNLIAPDFEGTFAAEVILVTQYEVDYLSNHICITV